MDWELLDGDKERGPMPEASVIDAIGKGLKPTAKVRPVGKESWKLLGSHEPFAQALERSMSAVAKAAPLTNARDLGLKYYIWEAVQVLAWLSMIGWSFHAYLFRYQAFLMDAKGAVQEIAGAADTAVRLVIGYIVTRALDKLAEGSKNEIRRKRSLTPT